MFPSESNHPEAPEGERGRGREGEGGKEGGRKREGVPSSAMVEHASHQYTSWTHARHMLATPNTPAGHMQGTC